MKRWIIEKLGGYPDIDSAIDSLKKVDLKERHKILSIHIKTLFNTIGPEDILSENSARQWTFEGKILTEEQKSLVQAEMKQIAGSFSWRILQADVKYKVNRKMFIDSVNEMDMIAGKLWLHTLNTLNTRIKSIIEGKVL